MPGSGTAVPDTPREEITVPRSLVLELVKLATKRHPGWPIPRLDAAITTIANIGEKQGYRAARWLVPADALWMIAHVTDARVVYEPGTEELEVALIIQNAVRDLLEEQAPATCRALRKLWELGEIVTCGHCRGPWSVTHTCEGQPEPALQTT